MYVYIAKTIYERLFDLKYFAIYFLKGGYLSEPESHRSGRMSNLEHRTVEGIGPLTNDGMPLVLRSVTNSQQILDYIIRKLIGTVFIKFSPIGSKRG